MIATGSQVMDVSGLYRLCREYADVRVVCYIELNVVMSLKSPLKFTMLFMKSGYLYLIPGLSITDLTAS